MRAAGLKVQMRGVVLPGTSTVTNHRLFPSLHATPGTELFFARRHRRSAAAVPLDPVVDTAAWAELAEPEEPPTCKSRGGSLIAATSLVRGAN
mmetsp:Transcript_52464/g.137457  ORF Transcript_52464/g.137457 Transcript_52464/m.137457 type:complete len:93 (-) Transcript_52464:88-366(-)